MKVVILYTLLTVFSQLSMRDGLSQNTVFSIAKDNQNIMWFATYDGINRYDGYNFTTYHVERDPDFVQVASYDPFIFVDSSGSIWAYDGGISRYDDASDSFKLYKGVLHGPVSGIAERPDGNILIATGGDIFELDPKNAKTPARQIQIAGIAGIRSLCCHSGLLAVGTEDGHLSIFRAADMALVEDFALNSGKNPVTSVHFLSSSEIWAISDEIFKVDLRIRSSQCYSCVDFNSGLVVKPLYISADKDGNLYTGSFSLLFKYNRMSDSFEDISTGNSLPKNIKSVFFDSEGGMWVGSFRSGVFYSFDYDSIIRNIDIGLPSSDLAICSISEIPDGKILISTQDHGFVKYDPSTGRSEAIRIKAENLDGGVMSSLFDKNSGVTYFGNNYGITCYTKATEKLSFLESPESGKIQVYSFARENADLIWVGSLSGLYLFNTVSGSFSRVPGSEHLFTYKVFRDSENLLWVATSSGLYKTELSRNSSSVPQCGPFVQVSDAQDVHDILKVGDILYVAARNGLFEIGNSGKIRSFDTSDGLSSNFLNGLEVDRRGNIWIGTEYGLDCLDIKTGRILSYYKEDGTGVDYFTKNAHCCSSNGTVYFGGVGGLCRIDPSSTISEINSEIPIITGIYVNGTKKIIDKSNIELKHSENNLKFNFAVQNYSSKGKSTFFYRLSGIDNEWRFTNSPSSVTYPSLRPGRYLFELYSTNKNSVPCKEKVSIQIRILRPWYFSLTAIIVYAIILALILTSVIYWVIKRNRLITESAVNAVKEQSRAEMDRLRIQNLTDRSLPPDEAAFVMKMVNIIEKNISNVSFGVEQLADEMCMSRSNLFLKFKNITGDSASRFIRVVRFNKACQLLSSTNKTIEEIAQETGYSSGASFSTSFKQIKGVSPSDWRH